MDVFCEGAYLVPLELFPVTEKCQLFIDLIGIDLTD